MLQYADELYRLLNSSRTDPTPSLAESLALQLATALSTVDGQEQEIDSLQEQVDALKDANLELTLAELKEAQSQLTRLRTAVRALAAKLPDAKTKAERKALQTEILRSL